MMLTVNPGVDDIQGGFGSESLKECLSRIAQPATSSARLNVLSSDQPVAFSAFADGASSSSFHLLLSIIFLTFRCLDGNQGTGDHKRLSVLIDQCYDTLQTEAAAKKTLCFTPEIGT